MDEVDILHTCTYTLRVALIMILRIRYVILSQLPVHEQQFCYEVLVLLLISKGFLLLQPAHAPIAVKPPTVVGSDHIVGAPKISAARCRFTAISSRTSLSSSSSVVIIRTIDRSSQNEVATTSPRNAAVTSTPTGFLMIPRYTYLQGDPEIMKDHFRDKRAQRPNKNLDKHVTN